MIQIVTGECCNSGESWVALDAADAVAGVVLARQDTNDLKALALLYIAVSKTSRRNGVFSSLMEKLKSKAVPLTANRLNKATDIAPRRERITAAGAALEEAQLLMYPSGSSQERIERGSQSPCATSKPAANGLPMPYAAHCESAW